jgi:glycosyltransferase involved in cell wall biosynthesis
MTFGASRSGGGGCALIALDARMPVASGIGNYLLSAARAVEGLPGVNLGVIVGPGGAEHWARAAPGADITVCGRGWYTLSEQIAIPWHARGANVLHVPHYNIPVAHRGVLVSTIHDVLHLTFPGYADTPLSRAYARFMLRAAVRRSRRVVTVSEFSRGEIVRTLGADPSKIRVIYNGVNPAHVAGDRRRAAADAAAKWNLEAPFLLYVGNSKPHKNLAVLGEAFALLSARRSRLVLVLALGGDAAPEWARGQARVRVMPRLRDDELAVLYGAADILALPSLGEGFGFPVVEAMASGTPVVCARAGALPEVAGDAAVYFPPRQPAALAAAVGRLLDDAARRRWLRDAGRERVAQRFTWSRCAAEHRGLYAELLDQTGCPCRGAP